MRVLFLVAMLLLGGCASKIVEYQPVTVSDAQARSVIEQVLMEQPQSLRPEHVAITDDYVAYGNGVISETNGFAATVPIGDWAIAAGSSRTNSKALQTRIYFNSIGAVTLYSKRSRWVVLPRNQAGSVINSSLVDTQSKAQRFVDAMTHFKRQ